MLFLSHSPFLGLDLQCGVLPQIWYDISMEQDESLDTTNEYFKHLGKITQEIDREETARL